MNLAYEIYNEQNTKEIKEILFYTISQKDHFGFHRFCDSLCNNLNLQCDVEYIGTYFGFPYHSVKYKVIVSGLKNNIDIFKEKVKEF